MRFQYRCHSCGAQAAFETPVPPCGCGGTMLVEYDLELAGRTFTRENLSGRVASMWRYIELLPVMDRSRIVTLGEGWTPLVRMHQAEKKLPLGGLWVKREEQNPTGSFKSRGFSAAVTIAHERGIRKVAAASNGNAASALAAYAAYAGMECFVFVPRDCPPQIVRECVLYGAETMLVDGYIHDAGAVIRDGEQQEGWYNVSTLKEPGRAEGKKTMGLELAEQLNWQLPDVIIYPTGGGSGVIGMWNAFRQLQELGWIDRRMPRFVCVQEQGCTPLVDAVEHGGPFIPQQEAVTSSPTGMRVPNPPDGQLLLSIMQQTGGTSVAAAPEHIQFAQKKLGNYGISASPEGAAAWAAMLKLLDCGWVRPSDKVVLFNTSHAMKYWDAAPVDSLPIIVSYEHWRGLKRI